MILENRSLSSLTTSMLVLRPADSLEPARRLLWFRIRDPPHQSHREAKDSPGGRFWKCFGSEIHLGTIPGSHWPPGYGKRFCARHPASVIIGRRCWFQVKRLGTWCQSRAPGNPPECIRPGCPCRPTRLLQGKNWLPFSPGRAKNAVGRPTRPCD